MNVQDFRTRRVLGRTGMEVSRLGLASGYGIESAAVEEAYGEYGVNYFYWGSRRGPGMRDALRRIAGADRGKIIVALQTYDHLGFYVRSSVEKGLRALGVDYADVLILGWFNRPPGRRLLDAASRLKESGKIRFLAMSGHNRRLFGTLAQDTSSPIDVFMVRYNAGHRGAEDEIFPYLPPEGAPGLTVYTATRWGRLLDQRKMPAGEKAPTAAECYRFVLTNPRVDLCMAAPRNMGEMREGLKALADGPLTGDQMERLRRIGDHLRR